MKDQKHLLIREVILNQVKVMDFIIKHCNLSPDELAFYRGNRAGLMQIVELCESEDERIRMKLYHTVLGTPDNSEWFEDVGKEDMLAWLEKQKEQKPTEWSDTDTKEAIENLITCCRDWERGEQTTLIPIVAVRARYFLEHLTEND